MTITQDIKGHNGVEKSKAEVIAHLHYVSPDCPYSHGLVTRGYVLEKLTKIKGGYRAYLTVPATSLSKGL